MVCQVWFSRFLRWRGYGKVVGRLHLELVHSLTGAGNHQTVGIIRVRHILILLFESWLLVSLSDWESEHSLSYPDFYMRRVCW